MKETLMRQIIAKQDELITLLDQASIRGWTNIMQKHKMNFYDEIADLRQQLKAILRDQVSINSTKSLNEIANELENLYYRTYLNECIAKAEPNLSKIKDVDRELAEIRGEKETCDYCKYEDLYGDEYPCRDCIGWSEWEPKTE